MKLLALCLFVLYSAILPTKTKTVFDYISTVNAEWFNPAFSVNPFQKENIDYTLSEQEIVRLHLKSVEELLQSRSILSFSASQLQSRKRNLALLNSYWRTGSFPKNITHTRRIPIFVDDYNVPCAVGYLMLCAGYSDFVEQTRNESNNIYIRQIRSVIFTKFQKESGFTIDELALIQPTYYPEYHGEHLNFKRIALPDVIVTAFATDTVHGLLYAAGSFTAIENSAMNNLAVFNGTT
jgi:hypothetical protein